MVVADREAVEELAGDCGGFGLPVLAGAILSAFKGDAVSALVGLEPLNARRAQRALGEMLEVGRAALLLASGVGDAERLGMDQASGMQVTWLGETVGPLYLRGVVRILGQAAVAVRAGSDARVELELAVLTIAAEQIEPANAGDGQDDDGPLPWRARVTDRRRVERRHLEADVPAVSMADQTQDLDPAPSVPAADVEEIEEVAAESAVPGPAVAVPVAEVGSGAEALAAEVAAHWFEIGDSLCRLGRLRRTPA